MTTFLFMNATLSQQENTPIKVCIIDTDLTIRGEISDLIEKNADCIMVRAYPNCEEAISHLLYDQPDVILMDIELSCGKNGIEGLEKIKKIYNKSHIIVITDHIEDKVLFKALNAGAGGYLTRDTSHEKLLEAIIEIKNGGAPLSASVAKRIVSSFHKNQNSPLTQRETEVLELLSKGKSYTHIAEQLFVNKETIRSHMKNIYWKLEVHNKAEAIEKAFQERLI